MTEWPTWHSTVSQTARLDKVDYDLLYQYGSTVRHAAGAFNWRVQAGDRTRVHEFGYGQVKLAAELTQDELAWSRSSAVPPAITSDSFRPLTHSLTIAHGDEATTRGTTISGSPSNTSAKAR